MRCLSLECACSELGSGPLGLVQFQASTFALEEVSEPNPKTGVRDEKLKTGWRTLNRIISWESQLSKC